MLTIPALDEHRTTRISPLLSPALLRHEIPIDDAVAATVTRARADAVDILDGRDDRLLVVVGPCSIHDPAAALDYAHRLASHAARVPQRGSDRRRDRARRHLATRRSATHPSQRTGAAPRRTCAHARILWPTRAGPRARGLQLVRAGWLCGWPDHSLRMDSATAPHARPSSDSCSTATPAVTARIAVGRPWLRPSSRGRVARSLAPAPGRTTERHCAAASSGRVAASLTSR